jgi:hypothetical protein
MSKKPRIEEYHEPAGGWGAALATGVVLRELQRPFAGKRNSFFLRSLGAIKSVVLGGKGLQCTGQRPYQSAEAACQAFRRWAGKESVPLREEFYSADSLL